MRVKHPARKRQMDRLLLFKDDHRAAQQLLNLRGSRDCMRCGGLLVTERMNSSADALFDQHTSALRCIQCGDIVDPVILRNRMDPVAARREDPKEALWEDQPEELQLCAAEK